MDKPRGKCPKCGKPYERLGARFNKHVAVCSGKAWAPRVPRGKRGGKVSLAEAPTTFLSSLDQVVSSVNNRRLDILRQKELVREQITILDNELGHLDSVVDLLHRAKKE